MADGYRWTVLCKMPYDKRGEYSEEIDIITTDRSPTRIKQAAADIIAESYDPELRPVRVIQTGLVYISSIGDDQ